MHVTVKPFVVWVAPIKAIMTAALISGMPCRFLLMKKKQTVFDLVPFACSRRIVKDGYCPPLGGLKPPALAGSFSAVLVQVETWTTISTARMVFFRYTCTWFG
jgi:hypothetical protein